MPMLWDQHLHSSFSGDSDAAPEEMIARAKALFLPGITFTDHLDWDYFQEPGLFDLDYAAYTTTIRRLSKTLSTETFQIRCGLELGLQEHLLTRHKHFLQMVDFDLVIGSVHVVDFKDPYYDDFYRERTASDAYRDYFHAVLKNIEAFSDFDTLGHLDYVRRYVVRHFGSPDGDYAFSDYEEVLTEILKLLIRRDQALEVNTGALHKGFSEPNPNAVILKRYRELGGRLLTIGADAHAPENIGCGFSMLSSYLKDCGFSSYAVYTGRTPAELPL